MLKNIGTILAQAIGRGNDRAHPQSDDFSVAVTDRCGVICAAWRLLWLGEKRGIGEEGEGNL
jgi:hypothetical protein